MTIHLVHHPASARSKSRADDLFECRPRRGTAVGKRGEDEGYRHRYFTAHWPAKLTGGNKLGIAERVRYRLPKKRMKTRCRFEANRAGRTIRRNRNVRNDVTLHVCGMHHFRISRRGPCDRPGGLTANRRSDEEQGEHLQKLHYHLIGFLRGRCFAETDRMTRVPPPVGLSGVSA